jgi:uncharacterized membrane protein
MHKLALALLLACAGAQAAGYATVTPLIKGGSVKINSAGMAAGNVVPSSFEQSRPVRIGAGGTVTYLAPSGWSSWANGINAGGTIVGTEENAVLGAPSFYAVAWLNGSSKRTVFGGPNTAAAAINDSGQVAGTARIDYLHGSPGQAAAWNGGTLHLLDDGSALSSAANDISNAGHIAGTTRQSAEASNAVRWRDGVFEILWSPGQFNETEAINNKGWVVGYARNDVPAGLSKYQAMLWTESGHLELGEGVATDINDRGVVIGQTSGGINDWRGVMWLDGKRYALSDYLDPALWPDATIVSASSITENGDISAVMRYQGENWAVLLQGIAPVPEPSAWLLLLAGLALLYRRPAIRRTISSP